MTSSSTSLVLGFAAHLPPNAIEPFARSLRRAGYQGRFGVILAGYGEREMARLRALADFAVVVDGRYPAPRPEALRAPLRWLRDAPGWRRAYPAVFAALALAGRERDSLARWERLEFALEGLQSLRYGHYFEVLRDVAPEAEEILLTDLRDVLFQADPFSRPVPELEVCLEEPGMTLAAQINNRRWLTALYGPQAVESLGHFTASCSGTVIGRRDGVLAYLEEMQKAILWRRRPLGCHDQGVHNYLLRTGRLGQPTIVENGCGRILTMGGMASVLERSDGVVLNKDGSVPAVLHQYDRDPERAPRILARLAEPATASSGPVAPTLAPTR